MTPDTGAGVDWSLGTYDGVSRAQARDVATLTPEQRLEWLDEALTIALASGALRRIREERARLAVEMWSA